MPNAITVTPPAARVRLPLEPSTVLNVTTMTPPAVQTRLPLAPSTVSNAATVTPPTARVRLPLGSPTVPGATVMTPPAVQTRLPLAPSTVPNAATVAPPTARVRLPLGSPTVPGAAAMTPPAVVEPWLSSAWSAQASMSLPHIPYQHPSQSAAPQVHEHLQSFTELLNSPNIELATSQPQRHPQWQEWDSFTKHFTMAFESLKADVEYLKTEVKYLKGKVKERKATQTATGQTGSSYPVSAPDEQQCLDELVKNVQPPREALKILLYHLFTMEELKTQSLKGVATKGASGNGLDKKRIAQLNTAMRNTFPTILQSKIDEWIRGQQKKLQKKPKDE